MYLEALLEQEKTRQRDTINLIASENFVSDRVLKALGSEFTNKYAEGYPSGNYPSFREVGQKGRYYGGCAIVDEMEQYCCDKWKEVFNTDYHVNVQPHSGTNANMAAYLAFTDRYKPILSLDLKDGGHLSHGSNVNFSGKNYKFIHYGLDENGFINWEEFKQKIITKQPSIILVGASAYSQIIDFKYVKDLIDEAVNEVETTWEEWGYMGATYNPIFMVDMAHIAGLVAAGVHPSPFGYADVITTTTHKTLRGPRGGLIFCKPEYAKQIDKAVFPGVQGGPLENIIFAKAVAAEEACTKEFKKYGRQIVENTKFLCDELQSYGFKIVTGGTSNHMFLVDLTDLDITGKELQEKLEEYGIYVNKNCIPNETRSPNETSGIRIGLAAETTKGITQEKLKEVAYKIYHAVQKLQTN